MSDRWTPPVTSHLAIPKGTVADRIAQFTPKKENGSPKEASRPSSRTPKALNALAHERDGYPDLGTRIAFGRRREESFGTPAMRGLKLPDSDVISDSPLAYHAALAPKQLGEFISSRFSESYSGHAEATQCSETWKHDESWKRKRKSKSEEMRTQKRTDISDPFLDSSTASNDESDSTLVLQRQLARRNRKEHMPPDSLQKIRDNAQSIIESSSSAHTSQHPSPTKTFLLGLSAASRKSASTSSSTTTTSSSGQASRGRNKISNTTYVNEGLLLENSFDLESGSDSNPQESVAQDVSIKHCRPRTGKKPNFLTDDSLVEKYERGLVKNSWNSSRQNLKVGKTRAKKSDGEFLQAKAGSRPTATEVTRGHDDDEDAATCEHDSKPVREHISRAARGHDAQSNDEHGSGGAHQRGSGNVHAYNPKSTHQCGSKATHENDSIGTRDCDLDVTDEYNSRITTPSRSKLVPKHQSEVIPKHSLKDSFERDSKTTREHGSQVLDKYNAIATHQSGSKAIREHEPKIARQDSLSNGREHGSRIDSDHRFKAIQETHSEVTSQHNSRSTPEYELKTSRKVGSKYHTQRSYIDSYENESTSEKPMREPRSNRAPSTDRTSVHEASAEQYNNFNEGESSIIEMSARNRTNSEPTLQKMPSKNSTTDTSRTVFATSVPSSPPRYHRFSIEDGIPSPTKPGSHGPWHKSSISFRKTRPVEETETSLGDKRRSGLATFFASINTPIRQWSFSEKFGQPKSEQMSEETSVILQNDEGTKGGETTNRSVSTVTETPTRETAETLLDYTDTDQKNQTCVTKFEKPSKSQAEKMETEGSGGISTLENMSKEKTPGASLKSIGSVVAEQMNERDGLRGQIKGLSVTVLFDYGVDVTVKAQVAGVEWRPSEWHEASPTKPDTNDARE